MWQQPSSFTRSTLPLIALLAACALGGVASAAGCSEPPSALTGAGPTGSGGSATGTGGGGAGGAPPNESAALFAALEPELFEACGDCHDAAGIANTPFLAGPNRYTSVVSWPGVVTRPAADSLFLTYAVSNGGHSGVNLDSDPALLDAVTTWLEEEARGISAPVADVGPQIAPFTPIMGFNAVYLDALGAELTGMALTFNAELVTDTTLELTLLEVHPTSKLGVHLVHPLFVVYPKGGGPDPDPVDSFSNVDQYFDAGETLPLGPGIVVIANWLPDAKLSIAFEKIEPFTSELPDAGEGGVTGGCKDPDAFIENAQGPLGTCDNCHAGQNGQATGALDMSDLQTDPVAACAQVLNRVSLGDPASSQVFINTDPSGNAAHPFKFNGDQGAWSDFRDSVSLWITAEQ